MISDVFSDAVDSIDKYLTSEVYDKIYDGVLRKDIVAIRNDMDHIRSFLDSGRDSDEYSPLCGHSHT